MPTSNTGFWGVNTATVDWCETNYEHLHYVCELFNSVSSLAMVLAGVLGVALHRRVLERRFLLAFAMVSVVGIGSTTLNETLPAYGIPNPQLHAWWHVLVSCGFYALLMVIAHDRLRTLGQAPRLRFAAGVIPLVRGSTPP